MSENIAGLFRELYEGIANGKVGWENGGARFVRGTVDRESVLRAFV